ncbi:uncharacterized protein LOC132551626 [Ylistrum balloti]|uniref:uncharacterized protein LOC132551626 n=1 Tax=Ylistrum balloti TaxID=509963 RepID=UPI0029059D54|nr:uncharacterized protein LOC132551626 [Ylistrum balloti]
MILSAFLCLFLFSLTTAQVIESSERKAQNDFPVLEKRLEVASLACEQKINTTIDTCLKCIETHQNSGGQGGGQGPSLDQLIVGVIPSPLVNGLGKFANDFKTTFEKDVPKFFTGTIPKTVNNVGKEIDKFFTGTIPGATKIAGKNIGTFFTGTLPGATKTVGKHLDTFFTGTLPGATKTVGKHLDTFFTGTIPNVGKDIKNGFESLGNKIAGIFGRRRRAAHPCPSCDRINTDSKSADQIRRDVCGNSLFNVFDEYTNTVNIFDWLKEGNLIVSKVSFKVGDKLQIPPNREFAKPFTVTYSIGAGDTPKNYKNTTTYLDVTDYNNEEFGLFLAEKIWKEYVFGQ